MQPSWQIPRPALFWLLATQAVVAVLQAGHLPLWLLGAGALVFGWRILIYQGRGRYPGRWTKTALMVLCGGAIVAEYGQVHGLEPMVTLLWCGFLLKLLEMHQRRDALILVCLGYFVTASHALFDQTPAGALVMLAGALLVTAALAALFQRTEGGYWRPLRTSGLLLLEAVPLMLVLFLVMPRLGSLWTVPSPSPQGTIGIDDELSPGDLGALGISDELAFRVEFEGAPPSRNELYWRGPVLSRFDGRRWSRIDLWDHPESGRPRSGGERPQPWEDAFERLGRRHDYQVIIEPTGNGQLFALQTPVPRQAEVMLHADSVLTRSQPVTSRWRYQVHSWLDHRIAAGELSAVRAALETALPGGANPRARETAVRWRREAGSDQAFIDRVLAEFHDHFIYSLRAPTLGADAVDEFLFETRKGFCEHFASSFAVLMRAAGIPARVVVGYQGGQYHPDAGYLIVRQYDAHAWAEVWLPGRGWLRVDPTAAVAPERIEISVSDLLDSTTGVLSDSPLAGGRGGAGWRSRLRLQLDYYDYLWARWVLGYELRQEQLLRGWLGGWDPWRIGLFIVLAGVLALVPVLVGQLRLGRRPPRPPLERLFLDFTRRLARHGIQRRTGEGPRSLAARTAREQPALAERATAIGEQLEQGLYGDQIPPLDALRHRIRGL